MKKSIFIIAALCAATFANAQITLEKTFGEELSLGAGIPIMQGCTIRTAYININNTPQFLGPYAVEPQWFSHGAIYDVYDLHTLNHIKTFNSSDMAPADCYPYFISRGFFTTDNKWAWAYVKQTYPYDEDLYIVTEDNTELLHVSQIVSQGICIIKVGEQYKLLVVTNEGGDYATRLYSLPGKGDSGQDISTPVAPRNSRKVLKKDQVLVENADKTYTLQGQEVK